MFSGAARTYRTIKLHLSQIAKPAAVLRCQHLVSEPAPQRGARQYHRVMCETSTPTMVLAELAGRRRHVPVSIESEYQRPRSAADRKPCPNSWNNASSSCREQCRLVVANSAEEYDIMWAAGVWLCRCRRITRQICAQTPPACCLRRRIKVSRRCGCHHRQAPQRSARRDAPGLCQRAPDKCSRARSTRSLEMLAHLLV